MGNLTNRDQWAARERLRFIERQAWWKATVNRRDLQDLFGISAAQASADLQAYQEANPTSLLYNLRAKRYEAQPGMICVFHVPRLEEALSLFLGDAHAGTIGSESNLVGRVLLPVREPVPQVARRIFVAIECGRRVWMRYWSVNSKKVLRREIAPHAFGHDGYRWHARAWCFENEDFRDFVLSRIEEAEWPSATWAPPVEDEDWRTFEQLRLRPWSGLTKEQRLAIRRDYHMSGDSIEVTVRRALKPYLLAHLRLANGLILPQQLEVVE